MAAHKVNEPNQLITHLIRASRTTEFVEKPSGLSVDVRDVPRIHKLSLEKNASYGSRLFIGCQTFTGHALIYLRNKNIPEERKT
ncbi:UNVERIFIED_CONTAM: hypothetical protein ACS92_03365 [Bacillus cereus]